MVVNQTAGSVGSIMAITSSQWVRVMAKLLNILKLIQPMKYAGVLLRGTHAGADLVAQNSLRSDVLGHL